MIQWIIKILLQIYNTCFVLFLTATNIIATSVYNKYGDAVSAPSWLCFKMATPVYRARFDLHTRLSRCITWVVLASDRSRASRWVRKASIICMEGTCKSHFQQNCVNLGSHANKWTYSATSVVWSGSTGFLLLKQLKVTPMFSYESWLLQLCSS